MVAALIQARMTSTRLPGKVMRLILGQPMLHWVVERARAIRGVKSIMVIVPEHPASLPIIHWCLRNAVPCLPGDPEPLSRFAQAVEYLGLKPNDRVMRLTADCPILDPRVSEGVLALESDYAGNTRDWPDGLDTEVFTVEALRATDKLASTPNDREHVTPFMRAHLLHQELPLVPPCRELKWSVDTEEELAFVQQVYEVLPWGFGWEDVLRVKPSDACLLCRTQTPHAQRARGSIGGPRDYTIWDLHEVEASGGAGIAECPAWALHRDGTCS